ncbi:MAG: serine hydrolase [Gemmatimonadales bacterium]
MAAIVDRFADSIAERSLPSQDAPATQLARRVDSLARARVPAGFSGSILLARGDSVVLHRGYGQVNGDSVSAESRFWIASTAKQFVSTAILLLRDRGLLSLDDTIARFIKDLPSDKRGISIRQLLTHTSGFGVSYAGENAPDARTAIARMTAEPMAGAPGTAFRYSTINYQLAAAVVEIAAGEDYHAFVRRELWAKAAMRATGFTGDASARLVEPAVSGTPPRLRKREWGAEGVYSTAGDLWRWYRAVNAGRVISPSGVAELFRPAVSIQEGQTALGWFLGATALGTRRLFTRGSEGFGANSLLYVYPDRGFTLIILSHAGMMNDDLSWPRGMLGDVEQLLELERSPGAKLRLVQFGAGPDAFHVVSTLIVGPTECVLWDAQYKVSDGRRLAEQIATSCPRLREIILSHADHDHYMGALEVTRRFPGVPVYMTASALADFKARSQKDLASEKTPPNPEAPDSLVTPQLIPAPSFAVDGVPVQVIPDLSGDVRKPASSALWIPSQRTVLVADLAFNGTHPWLGDADSTSRADWRASLRRIAALEPLVVISGHKRDLNTSDSPELLAQMDRYLAAYDSTMRAVATPAELIESMRNQYPQLALPGLMGYGARNLFKK